jgi:transcriptional regulator with XRE-family HTH domain
MSIGKAISQYRQLRKLTQQQLADACALHAMAISKIERGVCSPTWNTLVKIACVLEIRIADLEKLEIMITIIDEEIKAETK